MASTSGSKTRPESSQGSGDENQWQEDAKSLQGIGAPLGDPIDARHPNGPGEALVEDQGKRLQAEELDAVRRVFREHPRKLFARAAPNDEYLHKLSEAGVIKTKGRAEIICVGNECFEPEEPHGDCRAKDCPYAALMRMRLTIRLRAAYAHARNRLVGR